MAANSSPYIVNIVPLQGIATGITSSTDTASQITTLQANVANIQEMVQYDTKTISADYITSFTANTPIQFTSEVNLSTNTSVNSISSTIQFTNLLSNTSYIHGTQNTMSFVTAGNEILKITSTGMLQYMSSPIYYSTGMQIGGFLYVSEDAYVKTLYQISDKNYKTNIMPFSTCLDDILKLKPCSFNWLTNGDSDIGFIAQDVQKVWPSLTTSGTSIAYSRFVPLLLEGLRELHERVRVLEGLSK
jgi:hypothetical protein